MKVILKNSSLQFETASGIPQEMNLYFEKLSNVPTKLQKEAFANFYKTLKNAGLWSNIKCFLPMFGSDVQDCKFAIIGDDINIPNGATYDNGLSLLSGSGGIGPSGKGVKLYEYEYTLIPNEVTIIAATSKNTGSKGIPLIEFSEHDCDSTSTNDTSFEMWQAYYSNTEHCYPGSLRVTSVSDARVPHVLAFTNKIIEEGVSAESKCFEDGTLVFNKLYSAGGKITQARQFWKFYSGRKAYLPDTGGFNMVLIFDVALTETKIQEVSDAVKKLQNVLFVE